MSEIEVFYRRDLSHICLDIMPLLLIALAVSMVRSCDTVEATAVEAAGGSASPTGRALTGTTIYKCLLLPYICWLAITAGAMREEDSRRL